MNIKYIIWIGIGIVACLMNTRQNFVYASDFSINNLPTTNAHFSNNGNDFWGALFFKDTKKTSETVALNGSRKNCGKQVRWYYVNPARWLRLRPLDQDTLTYLKTIDTSYNWLSIAWGFFICDDLSIYGSILHERKGNPYYLIAGVNYSFLTNSYLPSFMQSMVFLNWDTLWYIFDNYWGIASLFGKGLVFDSICGNGIIEWDESCDQWSHNGQVGYCNATCNWPTNTWWTVSNPGTVSNGGWGGWGWGANIGSTEEVKKPAIDIPLITGIQIISGLHMDKITNIILPLSDEEVLKKSPYSVELSEAYIFAYKIGITSQWPITSANLEWALSRKHAAKMISQFAMKLMNKEPDWNLDCEFNDISKEWSEMQYYMVLACKLGIMGLNSNGTPAKKFDANTIVTRAQFGTMLSRLLYGSKYNTSKAWSYYTNHLNALKKGKIMNNISKPLTSELRGNVIIMMQRVASSQ